MTLQEAIQSGKPFNRQAYISSEFEGYSTARDFLIDVSVEDVLATDYVLEPDPSTELTEAEFRSVWNEVRSSFTSVKSAEESPLFRALSERLFTRGE